MCHGIALASSVAQLDAHFSCSVTRDEDEQVTYADSGEIRLDGTDIKAFRWESSLFRPTHGFDCSIDESDGLQAEVTGDASWRIGLTDGRAARARRGYRFERGTNCTIRVERRDDMLSLKPTCPALCGSRINFSELTIDLKTGACRYEQ